MKYAIGVITGVLATYALVRAADVSPAYAAPAADRGEATSSFCAIAGGTEANKNDMVWFFYKRPGKGAKGEPEERITMALYKPAPGNVNEPRLRLHTVREISWDLQLMDLNGSTSDESPSVEKVQKAASGK